MTKPALAIRLAAVLGLACWTSPGFAQDRRQDRRRRHRLDDLRDRLRADDDAAGPCAVLLRHGAQEERARHHGAEPRRAHAVFGAVVRGRLHPELRRRRTLARQVRARVPPRHGHERDLAVRADHPGNAVHDLPDDLRDHHGGAGRGRGRGPHAVLGVRLVLRVVAARRLCADRPLGVGRRLPGRQEGAARLRRRHGGASQRRRRRRWSPPGCSASATATAPTTSRRSICRSR